MGHNHPSALRRRSQMESMSLLDSYSPSVEDRSPPESSAGARPSAEQAALDEAWRAVDNAVRSIFELARSLEFLSDAIRRVEAEPLLEYQESDYARYRA